MRSIKMGFLASLSLTVPLSANPNQELWQALCKPDSAAAQQAIAKGADVNARYRGVTPLGFALARFIDTKDDVEGYKKTWLELLKVLIPSCGETINSPILDDGNLETEACEYGNCLHKPPLHVLVTEICYPDVQFVISEGPFFGIFNWFFLLPEVKPNTYDLHGMTPIMLGVSYGLREACLQKLVEWGEDPTLISASGSSVAALLKERTTIMLKRGCSCDAMGLGFRLKDGCVYEYSAFIPPVRAAIRSQHLLDNVQRSKVIFEIAKEVKAGEFQSSSQKEADAQASSRDEDSRSLDEKIDEIGATVNALLSLQLS